MYFYKYFINLKLCFIVYVFSVELFRSGMISILELEPEFEIAL